jgi:hypothetical protein
MTEFTPPPVAPPVIPETKTNVLSIVSLVTGILGLVTACCSGILAPAAVITGWIGLAQIKKTGEKGKGMAIAGLITGGINLLITCVILVLILLVAFGALYIPFLDPSIYY